GTCASCKRVGVVPAPSTRAWIAFCNRSHRGLGRPPGRLVVRLEHLSVLCRHCAHAVRLGSRFVSARAGCPMPSLELKSTLTCPKCSAVASETMPTNACQWFYECTACHEVLQPLPGDCCVFCSYGTVKCPPMQQGASCCAGGT